MTIGDKARFYIERSKRSENPVIFLEGKECTLIFPSLSMDKSVCRADEIS